MGKSIGYNGETQELHVQFLSGGYYIYHDIPQEVFDGMLDAPSKGSFLNRDVKGRYQYTKQ